MNPALNWYESPEHWVDAEDIKRLGKWAFLALRDLIVKRESELDSFRDIFQQSLNNKVSLTYRQHQAVKHAEKARELGITESVYVSKKLGIGMRAAQRLLKRSYERMIFITYQNDRKMFAFDDSTAIYNEPPRKIAIDKEELGRIRAGLTYDCPCHGLNPKCKGKANGRFGLCFPCSKTYGANKEERLLNGYDWVQFMVADILAQSQKDAEKILFERNHMVNMDISDIA